MTPEQTFDSHQITRKSQSSFASSFFFLSPEKRKGIETIYAFCRLLDDAVDESSSIKESKEKIIYFKECIDKIYRKKLLENSFIQELSEVIEHFQIPEKYFNELIVGVETDLVKNRYQDFEELWKYTYGVASVVGLICMKIFGLTGPVAEEGAILLGRALQLTNILRDIRSDVARDRIYLPMNELIDSDVSESDFLALVSSRKFENLLLKLILKNEQIYEEAFLTMRKLPYKPILAAWIMGETYRKVLQKIKKSPLQVLEKKVSISLFSKVGILLSCLLKSVWGKSQD